MRTVHRYCRRSRIRFICSRTGNACLAAGLAGLGVLALPDHFSRARLARGRLVRLFEDWHPDSMPMYVAFPPNRHAGISLRVFIDWVVVPMAPHAPIADRGEA